ncbi:MAG: hypothetical protein FJW96_03445 [Actinobacteria bacterium]|nr:hypothetical protein [Actinomycetota bacterium]
MRKLVIACVTAPALAVPATAVAGHGKTVEDATGCTHMASSSTWRAGRKPTLSKGWGQSGSSRPSSRAHIPPAVSAER